VKNFRCAAWKNVKIPTWSAGLEIDSSLMFIHMMAAVSAYASAALRTPQL
jgi:hypothetical protein